MSEPVKFGDIFGEKPCSTRPSLPLAFGPWQLCQSFLALWEPPGSRTAAGVASS